jgi:heterodisulfide reductase subunit C
MRVEHTLEVVAVCPVDKAGDRYTCVVRCGRVIPVEKILGMVAEMNAKPLYQEDFTDRLSRALAAEVETVGWHSGVMTRVVCGGTA